MINFTPDGVARGFFELVGRHAPPPSQGALPPVLWGSEEHVRELFGDRLASLELTGLAKENLQVPSLAFIAFFTFAIMLSLLVFIFEGVRDAFDPRKTFQ